MLQNCTEHHQDGAAIHGGPLLPSPQPQTVLSAAIWQLLPQHPDKNQQIQRPFHPTGDKTVKHLNCCNNIHNILLLSNHLSIYLIYHSNSLHTLISLFHFFFKLFLSFCSFNIYLHCIFLFFCIIVLEKPVT